VPRLHLLSVRRSDVQELTDSYYSRELDHIFTVRTTSLSESSESQAIRNLEERSRCDAKVCPGSSKTTLLTKVFGFCKDSKLMRSLRTDMASRREQ